MNVTATSPWLLAGLLAGGFAAGLVFFASLQWIAQRLAAPERPSWGRLAAVQGLRLLGLGAALVCAARAGALPLAALVAGLIAARAVLVARARRTIATLPVPPQR